MRFFVYSIILKRIRGDGNADYVSEQHIADNGSGRAADFGVADSAADFHTFFGKADFRDTLGGDFIPSAYSAECGGSASGSSECIVLGADFGQAVFLASVSGGMDGLGYRCGDNCHLLFSLLLAV